MRIAAVSKHLPKKTLSIVGFTVNNKWHVSQVAVLAKLAVLDSTPPSMVKLHDF